MPQHVATPSRCAWPSASGRASSVTADAKGGPDTVAGDDHTSIVVSGSEQFSFSQTFGLHATQQAVYNAVAAPQVAAVLAGLDACVFAFGQTGSGKTFSMLGPEGGHSTQDASGPSS
jgi:kinesin family protein C2/C3